MFLLMFALVIGLLFGSFANVVIYRLPNKKSIIKPPSACPVCGKRLTVIELVPIFSWVFLGGKCRWCKVKISARYPTVELLCGLLYASMVYFSPTFSAIPLCVLAFLLLVVSFIDWDTQEIYDGVLLVGAVVGVAWVAFGRFLPELFPHAPAWYNALLGVIAGAVPLLFFDRVALLVWKKDGFGYGDVKLMAMAGIFLGWQLTLGAFVFGVLSSFPLAVYYMIKRRLSSPAKLHDAKHASECASFDDDFNGYFAFGPFLCIGALCALWFGETIFHALYFNW